MAELGFLNGQRAELIEGEIMVLSPQKAGHFTTTDQGAELLRTKFGKAYHVRMQGPLDLGPHSEPEPDIAVVSGTRLAYKHQHPKTAALIVEVSDSTLQNDRERKGSLYARAGIQDYWIVNLVDRQLEVYRQPVPDPQAQYGHSYSASAILKLGDQVRPLSDPTIAIAVSDFFP